MTATDYNFGNHAIAKAYESLKHFFDDDPLTDNVKSRIAQLFPCPPPSSLEALIEDVIKKERDIAAYFTYERNKDALAVHFTKHTLVKPYLDIYETENTKILSYLDTAKKYLDYFIENLELQQYNPQMHSKQRSWYQVSLPFLEQIKKVYSIVINDQESPIVQRITALHFTFETYGYKKKPDKSDKNMNLKTTPFLRVMDQSPHAGIIQPSETIMYQPDQEHPTIDDTVTDNTTFSWLTQGLSGITDIPQRYNTLHAFGRRMRERDILSYLHTLQDFFHPNQNQTDSEKEYLTEVCTLLDKSYQNGYLKRIAPFNFGRNKELIEDILHTHSFKNSQAGGNVSPCRY